MRQNQYQVNDRTHTTNTPRQDTHGQHWMSARAMSAHFFTSLHPCFTQSGTYDEVGKQGLVRHSQPLLRPVHESHHSQYIDRKTRRSPCRWSHTGRCDGQPQTVPTRFDTRVSLRQVFHLHQNYRYNAVAPFTLACPTQQHTNKGPARALGRCEAPPCVFARVVSRSALSARAAAPGQSCPRVRTASEGCAHTPTSPCTPTQRGDVQKSEYKQCTTK